MNYTDFLATKRAIHTPSGFAVDELHSRLFSFQRDIVRWAIQRGRAALFLDTGLGKTLCQLEWARHVCQHTGGNVLILAPLAVTGQTVREGVRFDIPVTHCKTHADVQSGINVTNYERLHHFDPAQFSGIVLDESSILKAFDGKTRKHITEFAQGIHYRLACTATPAPNDLIELTNHAEFLDIMSGKEIIALYFTQDGNTTHKWRLKGHARRDFYRWLASWAVAVRKPADIGYDNGAFQLPLLNVQQIDVSVSTPTQGMLFAVEAATLQEQRQARRDSLEDRVAKAAEIIATEPDESWIVWCDLNVESQALAKAIPGAVEVTGSDSDDHKARAAAGFADGSIKILVSKPSIFGFGLNWQHCARVVFVGVSHSFEMYYQALRRCWRFGQTREVKAYVITAETEGRVVRNLERKEQEYHAMMESLTNAMHGLNLDGVMASRDEMSYETDVASGNRWTLYLGDAVEQLQHIADDSVGLTVTSPPFPGMYAYTNSPRDMGNVDDIYQMIDHFRYLMSELLRVTMPGRKCCMHMVQLTSMLNRDGVIGLKDYRGALIEAMQDAGWVYAGEVTIEKNPQVQAVRNKTKELLFKTLATDASWMRMALADYLLQFRKPGENPEPIRAGMSKTYNPDGGWITEQEWIEWASPIWFRHREGVKGGIRETNVLNVACARDGDDERHLCPLQLDVIDRAIKLWSNPGDLVLDPFNGVGSTGVQALSIRHPSGTPQPRRYVGVDLKRSYFETARRNLENAEFQVGAVTLFDLMERKTEKTA
jgi:DNA modification methylase